MKYYGFALDSEHLPNHIGIIMDGNGRWAKKRGLDRVFGHDKGYQVLKDIIDFNRNIGVKYISVYAFSSENWSRPSEEVGFLMELAKKLVGEYVETMIKNDIKLMITGTDENLPKDLIAMLKEALSKTAHCATYTLNIVFNYGGRKEILDAARAIAKGVAANTIKPEQITEESFRNYLYQRDLPDVDLMIRTSGEKRISNFLLWQISYAELWFTKVLWPDFKPRHFCKAIFDYQKRTRRFGGL